MSVQPIIIQSFEQLKTQMKTQEFSVQWRVTSEIGPEWIGSSQTITFYLGDCALDETEFCQKLQEKLIGAIPIPRQSRDHVITGNGDITLKENQLEIDYEWEAAIPYQNPDKHGEGKTTFFP